MDRVSVVSSMINSIGYDPQNSTLEVEFSSGVVWQYYDFPESKWYQFESAGSKGKFFHSEIKDQYNGNRV